ncbi:MAG: hypothetical protein ACRDT8_12330 [Micromonosporaceae bacterium]
MAADDRFNEIKTRLYALPPDDFTAARDAAAADAPASLGKRVKALRRPTLSAWLVNLLALQRAEDLDALLTIGDRLRAAQRALRGGQLRDLSAQRQAAITSLLRLLKDLATERGKTIRDETLREAEDTLRAAVADPEVASAVRDGATVKPFAYSGIGIAETIWGDAAGRREPTRGPQEPSEPPGRVRLRVIPGGRGDDATPARDAPTDRHDQRPASQDRGARERAEKPTAAERAERAQAVLDDAERTLRDATTAEQDAAQRLATITEELEALRTRERQLRAAHTKADRDLRRSERRRQAAEQAVTEARRRLRG